MKNKARIFGIYLPVFAILLVAVLTLRTVALFIDFNFNTGYFIEKTLSAISDYITVAASVFFLSYIFTARRDMKLIPDFTSAATYVPTGMVSVALIFIVTWLFARASETKRIIELLKDYTWDPANLSKQRIFLAIL